VSIGKEHLQLLASSVESAKHSHIAHNNRKKLENIHRKCPSLRTIDLKIPILTENK
jgi:hypothetical protein